MHERHLRGGVYNLDMTDGHLLIDVQNLLMVRRGRRKLSGGVCHGPRFYYLNAHEWISHGLNPSQGVRPMLGVYVHVQCLHLGFPVTCLSYCMGEILV